MDPDAFGPQGSGSVIICTDPDPSVIKQNRKNLDLYLLIYDFFMTFYLDDVDVPSKSIKQKNPGKKLFFIGILKVTCEKSRIQCTAPCYLE